jgi:hypothetical protein
MKRFYKEKYHTASIHPKNKSIHRNVERGFNHFIQDALDSVDNLTVDREQHLSLCELGIGGGGAHAMLHKHSQDSQVLGVDLFDIQNLEYYKTDGSFQYYLQRWDVVAQDQKQSHEHLNRMYGEQLYDAEHYLEIKKTEIRPNKKPRLFHGMDAYKKSTAEHLVKVNGAKLDYVNDDASPHLGALNGLMDAYKDSISDEGILISTGPFGNGTSEAYARWETGQYLKDCEVLAEQGFVIFDMTEYRERHHHSIPITGYIISYLAMWAPDFNNYDNLLKKYEHNIINGKDNWKHE